MKNDLFKTNQQLQIDFWKGGGRCDVTDFFFIYLNAILFSDRESRNQIIGSRSGWNFGLEGGIRGGQIGQKQRHRKRRSHVVVQADRQRQIVCFAGGY